MSIQSFQGNTFVAFLDVCGFTELMGSAGQAERALDCFFRSVFEEVQRSHERFQRIDCIAVSDCAIAFARRNETMQNQDTHLDNHLRNEDSEKLESMLFFAKNVSRKLIQNRILLKGSIWYGEFKFENRIEIPGIDKAMFVGNAYLNAYRDVEQGHPKIEVGEIRLRPRGKIDEIIGENTANGEIDLLQLKKDDYYFYWMLNSVQPLNAFENAMKDSYRRRFEGIISVIKEYVELPARL
jgi:hypothetical protein